MTPYFRKQITQTRVHLVLGACFGVLLATTSMAALEQAAGLFPLSSVRLLEGSPFPAAVHANLEYLLAHDPDRLLAPFLKEAGLDPKAAFYPNWESGGLAGHTAGHYLSALSDMIAAGADTPDGELSRRLDYMLDELERCQKANANGYIGGVPGSRDLWDHVAAGDFSAHGFGINDRWVPWYNVHKTFAGLRDAYQVAGREKARKLLIHLGDWCVSLISNLSEEQMQKMLAAEHGGMNEALADIYAITGDRKYLKAARFFCHHEILDPLMAHRDELTGKHANTQIPKVTGLQRISALNDDPDAHAGARFFWETVTQHRSVVFGGNSVGEHFNPTNDFKGMLESRQGTESCNTYNMLRLSEQLFSAEPEVEYVDYYERALYNHILSAIHPDRPGYVYFTPIRPEHYRVYSAPEQAFWCCVGTGMENPGKYGEFIYAKAQDGIYVNLFMASELSAEPGFRLRQETTFPNEEKTSLKLVLDKPKTFSLYVRYPSWVAAGKLAITVNGEPFSVEAAPSSFVKIKRTWQDGDAVEVSLPMHASVERLPDGSDWASLLYGPIVLAARSGTNDVIGLVTDDHTAHGALVPLDQVPLLLSDGSDIAEHIVPDVQAGPMHFRLSGIVEPAAGDGVKLEPFYSIHDERYQMYWELVPAEEMAARREKMAEEERAREVREAATLDYVAVGEQQPETDHLFQGQGTQTGVAFNRRWRDGEWFQYTLNSRGEKGVELEITYWGGDEGRAFDILANGTRIASQELIGEAPDTFIQKRYPIPVEILDAAEAGRIVIKFVATRYTVGGVFDVRLMKF